MPDDSGDKALQKAISETLKKADELIKQYFKDARDTGQLPSQGNAIEQIRERMKAVYEAEAEANGLTTEDQKLRLEYGCYGKVSEKAEVAYRKFSDKYHPEINGGTPYHLDDSEKKDLKPLVNAVKAHLAKDLNDFLGACATSGSCPNEQQMQSWIDGRKSDLIKSLTAEREMTDAQKMWLRHQADLYDPELLKTYHAYADSVKITNSMPGNYVPDSGIDPESGATPSNGAPGGESLPRNTPKPVALETPYASVYTKTNVSFSGCDMVVSASMRSTSGHTVSVVMGSVQTISYSIYRKLSPINCIGNVNAKDYVGGPRTVAGSLVFTVFHQHWATELMNEFYKAEGYATNRKILMDEVAPIDLTVSMANEYGVKSRLAIYGVRLFSEGQVMSINDIYTENTYQYVALNVDYLANIQSGDDIWTPYAKEYEAYNAAIRAYNAEIGVLPSAASGGSRTVSVPVPSSSSSNDASNMDDKNGTSSRGNDDAGGKGSEIDGSQSKNTEAAPEGRTSVGPDTKQDDAKNQIDGRVGEEETAAPGSRTTYHVGGYDEDGTNHNLDRINVKNDLIYLLNKTISFHANGKTVGECADYAYTLLKDRGTGTRESAIERRNATVQAQVLLLQTQEEG